MGNAGVVLGLGTDLVEVGRIRDALQRRPRLLTRLFSEAEAEYAYRYSNPWPALAARFAAKEAVLKALEVGIGTVRLNEIQVCRAPHGAPSLLLGGRAKQLAEQRGISAWRCSLTHTAEHAQAVVLAWGEAPQP